MSTKSDEKVTKKPPEVEVEVEVEGRRTTATTTTNVYREPPRPGTGAAQGSGGGGHLTIEALQSRLQARGVIASVESLLETASLQAIDRSVDWWDRQSGAGPGVLVDVIRRGGIAERQAPMTLAEREREYGEQIRDWLTAKFPDLDRPGGWGPHPAAISEVIRLHHAHGKGRLTVREHGAQIRAAVRAWEARFSGDGDFTEAERALIKRRSAHNERAAIEHEEASAT